MDRFRFGLHVVAPSGREEWVRLARQAEDLGFSVVTVPDHLLDGCLSPFAALGVAAEATSTLRVGTLELNNNVRHPALVAREALTLDLLSRGLIELGLGAGSTMSSAEHGSIGLPFADAATRVARLAESVEVLDGLLRGDEVAFQGEHYRLIDHRAWPRQSSNPDCRSSSGQRAADPEDRRRARRYGRAVGAPSASPRARGDRRASCLHRHRFRGTIGRASGARAASQFSLEAAAPIVTRLADT